MTEIEERIKIIEEIIEYREEELKYWRIRLEAINEELKRRLSQEAKQGVKK